MILEPIITQILAAGSIVGLLALIAFVALGVFSVITKRDMWQSPGLRDTTQLVERYGLLFAFLITFTATLISLYYSEVVGWVPCTLCWYQRIFMYASTVVLSIAWWRNDRRIDRYVGPLLLIGTAIAVYHYAYQRFDFIPSVCPTSVVSCRQEYVSSFGFVSIPLMSLVGFLLAWVCVEFAREGETKWWRFF